MVAAKAKGLLLETLNSQKLKDDSSVQQEEKSWLRTLALTQWIHSIGKPKLNPEWRPRDKDKTFQSWWRQQGITTVFFDGA